VGVLKLEKKLKRNLKKLKPGKKTQNSKEIQKIPEKTRKKLIYKT
jgi:hypothetical protein